MTARRDPHRSRDAMVDALHLADPRIEAAMRRVPREAFVPDRWRSIAYDDTPVPLTEEATVSAPHMVALLLEALDVRPGNAVLEVGGGMGYLAAVLAELVGPKGRVDAIELDEELAAQATQRLAREGYGSVVFVHAGDGAPGLPGHAPYDRIVVSCATRELRREWKDQLVEGGRLVAPVGNDWEQTLVTFVRAGKSGLEEEGVRCRFVPLRRPGIPHI
jgi:protein-L-isoaspartate(D-aspartate) O-methyltransferase